MCNKVKMTDNEKTSHTILILKQGIYFGKNVLYIVETNIPEKFHHYYHELKRMRKLIHIHTLHFNKFIDKLRADSL